MFWQNSIGIDIQERSLVLLYLKRNFKKVTIGGYVSHSLEHDPYLKQNPIIAAEYLRDFIKNNRIDSPDVYLCIPRELALMREIQLPLAVKENLFTTVTYELEKYIPFTPQEAMYDCQIIGEDKQKNQITVLLVAAKKADIAPYLDMADRTGVKLSGIEISSTALVNHVSSGNHASGSDINLLVCQKEKGFEVCWTRGGLLNGSRIIQSVESAEPAGVMVKELQAVKELVAGEKKPVSVRYFGDSSQLADFFEQDADFRLIEMDTAETIDLACRFLPAMGLARKGLENVPMQVNILPAALRKKPDRTPYYVLFCLAGLFMLLMILWGTGAIVQRRIMLNQLDAERIRLQSEVGAIDRIREETQKLETQYELFKKLNQEYPSIVEILRDLTQRIPKTAWLDEFISNRKSLQIVGTAESAADLIQVLESSPLFKEVVFLAPITRNKEGKEIFRIGMQLE